MGQADRCGCWYEHGNGGIANAIPLIAKGRAEAETAAADINYFLGIDASTGNLVADFEEGQSGSNPSLNHPITGTKAITADSKWHHVAATYDGTTWHLYLDGGDAGSLSVGEPANAATNALTSIGSALTTAGAAAGFFAGSIDEVRIWNNAHNSRRSRRVKTRRSRARRPGCSVSGTSTKAAAPASPTTPATTKPAPPSAHPPGDPASSRRIARLWPRRTATHSAGHDPLGGRAGVLGNDTDADGDSLTAVPKVSESHCTLNRHAGRERRA